jgi:hypothetical protein
LFCPSPCKTKLDIEISGFLIAVMQCGHQAGFPKTFARRTIEIHKLAFTRRLSHGIMYKRDKGLNNIEQYVESKEGERGPLSRNKANVRSPSLGFNPNSEFVSEDVAISYLASVLVEIFMHMEHADKQKGGDLLPRVYKGASG